MNILFGILGLMVTNPPFGVDLRLQSLSSDALYQHLSAVCLVERYVAIFSASLLGVLELKKPTLIIFPCVDILFPGRHGSFSFTHQKTTKY